MLEGRIARIIAAIGFSFVDQEGWDESRRTPVNDYRTRHWAFDAQEGELYPGMVVLNGDGSVWECVDVEMRPTFGDRTLEKW